MSHDDPLGMNDGVDIEIVYMVVACMVDVVDDADGDDDVGNAVHSVNYFVLHLCIFYVDINIFDHTRCRSSYE